MRYNAYSTALPAFLNMLCMKVAAATKVEVAQTIVSEDGQVLIVERFDIVPESGRRKGFEDFCSLLGLVPEAK